MLFGLPYYLIIVLPLAGSLLVPVIGRFNEKLRDWTPSLFMGLSMILCWSLLFEINNPATITSWIWIDSLNLNFTILLDPLSIIMGVLASTLCFLIYVYSTEYMAHEEDRDRFFFLMLAFGGGMLTLVLSDSLLIAFIGWEIMGFCSYGLIGFWNDKRNPPETDPTDVEYNNPLLQFDTEGEYNTHCGTKAFIVTRIGDAFMLAGILLLFVFTGTFSFTGMSHDAQHWWSAMATTGMLVPTFLLLFMGAIGKSGQAPLQIWLPEAMAGPTAVSALIHAATMVKAGVYISARFLVTMVDAAGSSHAESFFNPLQIVGFEAAIPFFTIVAIVGAITALMTATMGMVSNELKQVLAFSTLSQLGYMMLAIGVGGVLAHYEHAYLSSILHVISHGAFKALLFLASGGVIHALHTKYMTKMGGLKKHMRKTFIVMWIGVLALAGIPPFSGFWSKDSIIEYTYELALHEPIGWILFSFAVIAAACTIFYSLRLMGMTFYGSSKFEDTDASHSQETHEESHKAPHDPGPAMMIPLYILAAFTIIAFAIYPFVQGILLEEGALTLSLWSDTMVEMLLVKLTLPGLIPFTITLGALAIGGFPAYLIYIKGAEKGNTIIPEKGIKRKIYDFLKHRWYINEGYYWILNKFLNFASWWREKIDNRIIDGIDFRSADLAIGLSRRIRWFDDNVVDGFAEGVSSRSIDASEVSLHAQTGRINDYVSVIIFGVGLMAIIALIWLGVI
ncbi:MAG: conserved membrane protein of unknown function [Candidatus Thorarchaeota archaeon]|nr:MAG: conserved membrane protein of unknown function [Candidatus Thorarchaeota archaeon]